MTAEERRTYATKEAIAYLEEKHGITIEKNTFYQSVRRMRPQPSKVKVGMGMRYAFTREELDSMYFAKSGNPRHASCQQIEVVTIKDDQDMDALRSKYGRIVDGSTLISIIEDNYNISPTPESIKQRRYRKSIPCVGVSGEGRRIYWYAADFIVGLSFVKRSRKKKG